MDRGDEPNEMLDYIYHLDKLGKLIFICGNHDDMFIDCYRELQETYGYDVSSHHIHNGTYDSIQSLGYERSKEWIEFIKNKSLDYFETEHYIFVHGWIPCDYDLAAEEDEWNYYKNKLVYKEDWREASKSDWQEARWLNGMAMWNEGLNQTGKTIVCGHWHTSWGHSHLHHDGKEFLKSIETMYIDPETGRYEPHANHDPFIDEGIIALDACTVRSHKINVITLED